MKRKLNFKLAGLIALTAASAVGVISGTYAWFSNNVEVPFEGLVQNAYFKSGTGTSESDPFIISRPIHLYNLAWLQYIGHFNKDELTKNQDGTTTKSPDQVIDQQYYFRIELEEGEENLNMDGWVLPPIGTTTFPFLGHFDGNNVDIVNLKTANFGGNGGITKKPSGVLAITDVDIVGFFGVIGEYGNLPYTFDSNVNAVVNFGLDNYTVKTNNGSKLIGLAAGYVNGVLSGAAIGACTMDIPEGTTALDSTNLTSNLSDFGTVGYCTDDFKATTNITTVTVDSPNLKNGGSDEMDNEWGGSVPMEYFYRDASEQLTTGNFPKYKTKITTNYDRDNNNAQIGEPIIEYGTYTNINRVSQTGSSAGYRYFQYVTGDKKDDSGDILSSYSFGGRLTGNSSGSFDKRWLYLYGKKDAVATVNNALTTIDVFHQKKSGQTIAKGTVYLSNTNGTVSGGATQTVWIWDGTKLYSNYNKTAYYIARGTSQGNGRYRVALTTNGSDANVAPLTYDSASKTFRYSYDNSTYYLDYYNGFWEFRNQTTETYYTIDDNGNYFCNNGTTISSSTNLANASHLYRDDNQRFYCVVNGKSYYICDKNNTSAGFDNGNLQLVESTSYALKQINENNLTYVQRQKSEGNWFFGYTYHTWTLYFNNSNWGIDYRSSSNYYQYPQNVNIVARSQATDYSLTTNAVSEDEIRESSTTSNATVDLKPTYFPLNAHRDADKKPIRAASANTGYVVSGANFNWQSYSSSPFPGDIRVSQYGYSELSKSTNSASSYATSTTGNCRFEVLTRSPRYDSGNSYVCISDAYNNNQPGIDKLDKLPYYSSAANVQHLGLERYENARQKLDELFTANPTNVYGLHFMDAPITTAHTITVPKATVNELVYKDGLAYECQPTLDAEGNRVYDQNKNALYTVKDHGYDIGGNLEMPEDAIDFTLAKDGRINFFAASYFANNNSFFSLHKIERSTTTFKRDGLTDGEDITIPNPKITGIREVTKVYKNADWGVNNDFSKPQFVMEYDKGSPSEGTKGDLLFDMSWIKSASEISTTYANAMFYFEIPVIKGEYALGSVDGGIGAYLVYLDIGAADINAQITIVEEKITELSKYYDYPIGVDFVVDPASISDKSSIQGGAVAAIIVPASTTIDDATVNTAGTITFALEALTPSSENPASKKLTCGPPSISGAVGCSFAALDTKVESSGASILPTPSSWKQTITENTITYTYSSYTNLFSTVIYQAVTVSYSDQSIPLPEGNGVKKLIKDDSVSCTEEEYESRKIELYTVAPDNPYLVFDYEVVGDAVVTMTYEYSFADSAYHYHFVIASGDADVKILIKSVLDGFNAYINNELVSAGQTITVRKSA